MSNVRARLNEEQGQKEQELIEYLEQNPEFFNRHPDSLLQLRVPHSSGRAVSLIERQVSALRERNTELRNKLGQLLDNARENDRLFNQSKRLILSLLECDELDDFVDALYFNFDREFTVSSTRLILFGHHIQSSIARISSLEEAQVYLGRNIEFHKAVSGGLAPEELAYLFDKDRPRVGSGAFFVMNYNQPLGILAIGHEDVNHFQSGMGTLFLSHIGEVLNRILPNLLLKQRSSGTI